MNERIKELAGQAKFMAEEAINRQISKNAELDAFAEKFAELLLLECIELVETTPRHCAFTTYDLGTVECTIQKASERLHEYYGIQRVFKTTDERTSTKEIPNARRSL